MRQFPVYHAIAIAALLVSIFLVLQYLPDALQESAKKKIPKADPIIATDLKEVIATFRYNKKPKRILLTDEENNVLLDSSEIAYENEVDFDPVYIPVDKSGKSMLRLVVEWDSMPEPYYFFTLELNGGSEMCFGAHTPTSDLTEDVLFQWK